MFTRIEKCARTDDAASTRLLLWKLSHEDRTEYLPRIFDTAAVYGSQKVAADLVPDMIPEHVDRVRDLVLRWSMEGIEFEPFVQLSAEKGVSLLLALLSGRHFEEARTILYELQKFDHYGVLRWMNQMANQSDDTQLKPCRDAMRWILDSGFMTEEHRRLWMQAAAENKRYHVILDLYLSWLPSGQPDDILTQIYLERGSSDEECRRYLLRYASDRLDEKRIAKFYSKFPKA
jgi:hypothetical protein